MQGYIFNRRLVLLLLSYGQYLFPVSFSEAFTILSMYMKNPSEVGEFAPISQAVGVELSKFVGRFSKQNIEAGKKYLEAGGGCGAISICIAKKLGPNDRLDVIEINPDMCKILKNRLKNYSNVYVHCCSILDWHPEYKYDAMISTLPFLSLGIDFAKQAMNYFQKYAKKKCMFSCVEYPSASALRSFVHKLRLVPANFIDVQRYMANMRKKYLKECITIYMNAPPINVYHICFDL